MHLLANTDEDSQMHKLATNNYCRDCSMVISSGTSLLQYVKGLNYGVVQSQKPVVTLCVGWDKPKRSTKGQANTNPKAHVTNHNAYAWTEWLRASVQLSHAVLLRPVACRNIESWLLSCFST